MGRYVCHVMKRGLYVRAVRVAVRSLCQSGGLRRSFDDQHLPGTPAGGMRPLEGLTNTQRMSSAPA